MKKETREINAPAHSNDQKNNSNSRQNKDILVFPASITQQQFWMINQLYPDSPAYNIPSVFRLRGHLNSLALEQSINEIIQRHEVFRTTFTTRNGELLQVITPQLHIDLPVIDLSSWPKSKLDVDVPRMVRIEAALPFDLSSGPLIRAKLLRLSDSEHIFVITIHHTISDLHTSDQFAEELATLFDSYLEDKPSFLEKPTRQYSDYAVWQQEWLKGEEFSSMFSYWQQQLKDQSGFLGLPADRQRPAIQSLNGTAHPLQFSRSFTNELKQFSRQETVTIFLTLLSVYVVLLHRYSGQPDIVVGIPYTNRRRDEHKDTMGCFVNILPLSVDLSGDPSFRQVMHHLRKAMLGAHRHQEVPYWMIMKKLEQKRDGSYNPLFQVGFTFAPPMKLKLQGLTVESISIHGGGSQLDMFPTFWDSEQGIYGQFEYNTDIFDETTIERFANNYLTLLKAVMVDANQPISLVPILAESERKQLLVEWNATETTYPKTSGIHQLFEMQVMQTPDAIAVVSEENQLTYRELDRRANQLAHLLRTLGVGPETLVGICMERSAEMLVGVLGILKAGGAYVPLDPEFPKERVGYMLYHSEVRVLLTQQQLKAELPENVARVICLDTDWEEISQESEEILPNETRPENVAYVMYTSGSTGVPKGVQIPHEAVVNFLTSMRQLPGMTGQDVLLAVTTLSFDISVLELFLPLTVGARTVIVSRDVASDGKQLLEVLESSKVTVMQATPATWRLLIAADWKGSNHLKVLCGGEAMPTDLAHELIGRAASVWNMYGPTETTVWSTCYHLTDPEGPILIGRPIANTQIYILDGQMQPVPVGVPGEIHIGGAGVGRGYLKQPEMTMERFVPDPFGKETNARLYKTGDFGRYLRDGSIEYLHRIDNQIKVRGFRIELGEIETVLIRHPQVREVAVAMRDDASGNRRLIGYVMPAQEEKPTVESLRSFLQNKLPHYMVPELFVTLKALPLTPNNKIDRKALPDPTKARPAMEQVYVSPSTASERTLTDIWRQVLSLAQVGVHDNFFDLGGNSLLIIQVVARIRQAFDIDFPIVKLFQYPTIRSLTECLSQSQNDQSNYLEVQARAQRRKMALSRQKRPVKHR